MRIFEIKKRLFDTLEQNLNKAPNRLRPFYILKHSLYFLIYFFETHKGGKMSCLFEIKGLLGSDPSIKKIGESKKVCNFSIAENLNDYTVWHYVEAWGDLAELFVKNFKKGDLLLVEGNLSKKEENYKLVAKQIAIIPKLKKLPKITAEQIPL